MCGIVGKLSTAIFAEEEVRRATDSMVHRGPDDAGVVCFASDPWFIGLGSRRLSIIDLSPRGRQPMSNNEKTLWIVYNGEIYNFLELRRELEAKGYRFQSHTDTEVVLHAYAQWGLDCLSKFNGMFAFAIWDEMQKRLVFARDRLGVKPLYYARPGGGLAFASEVKALFQLSGVPRNFNATALGKFLSFLWVPDPHTMFRGIDKLPPGHYALFQDGKLDMHEYWDLKFPQAPRRLSEEQACDELLERLKTSVQRRLISDVPLGVFLSGGLDSSLLTVLMSRVVKGPVTACTVGFAAEDLRYDIVPDDLKYARLVKNQLPGFLEHTEIVLRPQVADLLPKIIWHLDEPVADPAALSTYLICKAAREKATVMLTGVGGEELFAGYPRHLGMKLAGYYSHLPGFLRNGFLRAMIDRLPASRPGPLMTHFRNLKKFVRAAEASDFARQYLRMRSYYTGDELKELLRDPDGADGVYEEHLRYFDRARDLDPLHQLLYVDTKTFLPCLNLTYIDKVSMAASVEVREPLLDPDFVEFVSTLPAEWKLNGFVQKYILKKAAGRLLPKELVWRKKAGFGAPIRAWVSRDLQPLIDELLSKRAIEARGLLRYEAVEGILHAQRAGREDNALRIWAFLTLELWMRTFMDHDGSHPQVAESLSALEMR